MTIKITFATIPKLLIGYSSSHLTIIFMWPFISPFCYHSRKGGVKFYQEEVNTYVNAVVIHLERIDLSQILERRGVSWEKTFNFSSNVLDSISLNGFVHGRINRVDRPPPPQPEICQCFDNWSPVEYIQYSTYNDGRTNWIKKLTKGNMSSS